MPEHTEYRLRLATHADRTALEALIALSARGLSREDYASNEIDAAIAHVFGVDSELLDDGSYFVVTCRDRPVACGGWSRRRTLFGGDRFADRSSGFLDPACEAAKIRAFFVHPDHARRGLARMLLAHCEREARRHGFTEIEMMATLPGVKLYEAFGYVGSERHTVTTPDGDIRFIAMHKRL